MAEPTNLNRRRKQRRREREQKQAAANRAWHGATRAERASVARERERRERRLDGLRRDASVRQSLQREGAPADPEGQPPSESPSASRRIRKVPPSSG